MKHDSRVIKIVSEISARSFEQRYASRDYEWLIQQCNDLGTLLTDAHTDPELVASLKKICTELKEQNATITHSLVREQTLVFQQDAVVYNLMKQGYLKMAIF